jgi:hypothetical protein
MNKPTKYKSINILNVIQRPVVPLNNVEKSKVLNVLNNLFQFIKEKHS